MNYLLDTVTLVRHFAEQGQIGKQAALILDGIEKNSADKFSISVVSLMEVMYLAEKKRIAIDLQQTLNLIQTSNYYTVVNLTPEILITAETIDFYDLHDRLILATAKWLDIPIISSDSLFPQVSGITVIWD
jgi:PIN domain nuclease of toxin-antitoxin system